MDNVIVDLQVEEGLIGSVLRGGKSVYEQAREIAKPEHFRNNAYGYAWLACENLYERGMNIDTITVGDELERMGKMVDFVRGQWSGRALLSDLRQNGDPRNVLSYAEKVQDYYTKRFLEQFFTKGVEWSRNGRTANEIIQDAQTEFSKITLYSSQDEFTVPISTAVSEAYDWTDAASRGEVVGVPTGYIDLDNILGSLYSGNVYIVAARPGQGKTAFLLSVAKNAALKNKRVGIFSLEMSRSQVAQRLISQYAEVDLNKITRGTLEEREWSIYTNAVENIAALPIVINDLSSIDINQIRQTARKIKKSGGLDLLIVDYIQLANSGEKRNERRELDVSAVSRGLKYLARELDVPVLAAAQLSRAVEQRSSGKPILSDLRESGSLEQDAYCVMFIYMTEDKPNDVEMIVAKHRNGPVGSCDLYFKRAFTRFENATSRTFNPNKSEVQ